MSHGIDLNKSHASRKIIWIELSIQSFTQRDSVDDNPEEIRLVLILQPPAFACVS